jgi:hypothetical protein
VVKVCDWLLNLLAPYVHNALGEKIPGSTVGTAADDVLSTDEKERKELDDLLATQSQGGLQEVKTGASDSGGGFIKRSLASILSRCLTG